MRGEELDLLKSTRVAENRVTSLTRISGDRASDLTVSGLSWLW